MAIYESLKDSIKFIEANLEKNIGVKDVADAVAYSQFYLSREFSKINHISIYDYIVKRKICESVKDLNETNSKIVDVAFKYGFNSHEVYTRAFKKVFGVNPSHIKDKRYLAYYKAIDDDYFDFLYHLRWEQIEEHYPTCYFEGKPTHELEHNKVLVVLSKDYNYEQYRLKGDFVTIDDTCLCYELKDTIHKMRVYHKNVQFTYRFFLNNFLDGNDLCSNYLLLNVESEYIDIMVPASKIPISN